MCFGWKFFLGDVKTPGWRWWRNWVFGSAGVEMENSAGSLELLLGGNVLEVKGRNVDLVWSHGKFIIWIFFI